MRGIVIVVAGLALALVALQSVAAFEYGNWCGANHPANPSTAPEPIDEVDAACKKHDLAVRAKGGVSGEADAEMVQGLVDLLNSGALADEEFAAAVVIATYMSGQQQVTVLRDVAKGSFSSIVKVSLAKGEATVALPSSVTAEMLESASEKIGGPGGKLLGEVIIVLRVPAKVFKEIGRAFAKVFGW